MTTTSTSASDGTVPPDPPGGMTVFVGGVGQLFQGDLDLGRVAVERLQQEPMPPGVLVEELHYGAIAVAQRLEEVDPDALILVGATERDRAPGTVERRRIEDVDIDADEVQVAMHDAGTGYVDLNLVVEVAWGLDVLPRTVAIEVEPARTGPSDELSPIVAEILPEVLEQVRTEVRRAPLLDLAARIRARLADQPLAASTAMDALHDLLDELATLDRDGRWGRTFSERDRLRMAISDGRTSSDMDHADWGMWWALIEELDRLAAVEAA